MLVAVNSGNPRYEVKKYMNGVGVDIPTIVDKSRALEQDFDFGKISLDNTIAWALARPDGTTKRLRVRVTQEEINSGKEPSMEPEDIRNAMGSPSWFVEPAEVPEQLKPLWRAVEFGQYRQAAKMFQQAERSEKYKQTVQRLKSVVHSVCEQQLNRASELQNSGKPWEAYKLLRQITMTFRSYPEFNPPKSPLRTLEENKTVKRERRARAILQNMKKKRTKLGAQWSKPSLQNALGKLIQKYPDTEAAKEAKELKAR